MTETIDPSTPTTEAPAGVAEAKVSPRDDEVLFPLGTVILSRDNMKVSRHFKNGDKVYVELEHPDGSKVEVAQDELVSFALTGHPEQLERRLEAAEEAGEISVEETVDMEGSIDTSVERMGQAAADAGEIAVGQTTDTVSGQTATPKSNAGKSTPASSGFSAWVKSKEAQAKAAAKNAQGNAQNNTGNTPAGTGGGGTGNAGNAGGNNPGGPGGHNAAPNPWTPQQLRDLRKEAEISHVRWGTVEKIMRRGFDPTQNPVEYILHARGGEFGKTLQQMGYDITPPEDTGRKPNDTDTIYENPLTKLGEQGRQVLADTQAIQLRIEDKKEARKLRKEIGKDRPGKFKYSPKRLSLAWRLAKAEKAHIQHEIISKAKERARADAKKVIDAQEDQNTPMSFSQKRAELETRRAAELDMKQLGMKLEVGQEQSMWGMFRHNLHILKGLDDHAKGIRAALRPIMRSELRGGSGSATLRKNLANDIYHLQRSLGAVHRLEAHPDDMYDDRAVGQAWDRYQSTVDRKAVDARRKEYNELIRIANRTPEQNQRLRVLFEGKKKLPKSGQPIWRQIFHRNQPWP